MAQMGVSISHYGTLQLSVGRKRSQWIVEINNWNHFNSIGYMYYPPLLSGLPKQGGNNPRGVITYGTEAMFPRH